MWLRIFGKSPAGKSLFKSFNYQDITQQMMRSQNELKSYGDSPEESSPHSSIQDITNRIASTLSDSPPHRPRLFAPKPPLDDNCALELHRSKSYIVNLIDRALSKELGTVPNERRKEFDNMNPKKAINVMNRHTGLCDKEFCFEITSALTDSIISNATAPDSPPSSSKTKVCCCGEEPSYIKQLKQLRWGHLKHIQREVRRLEDLESRLSFSYN
ncbi:hypothetical protein NQ318_009448 [Aromia moschata]|uniref:Uncharacterized protein n=1 Tax=Aromia moschata TaxID=1265417 RepID=A0AAV8Z8Y3_9CUCU|nr:hypothetical protein NQ318_009448 [Aromia moschata]